MAGQIVLLPSSPGLTGDEGRATNLTAPYTIPTTGNDDATARGRSPDFGASTVSPFTMERQAGG
jgi:hypothetical protein